ncbi:MAG TPA: LPS-assembly protein LptD [Burkholderiales bacterium]|nr:LPS-assembly protein LptD [Burkholderiales bacterium]
MSSRLATLAIALAAAGSALGQQSEQPEPTTIDAQKIEGVSDLEVSARGAAEIRRGDVSVFGQFLRYNREFGELEGTGGVRLQSGVDRFFGPTLEYNTLEDTGTFDNPGFLLQRERPARGNADRMEFLGPSHYRLFNARFTTCQPGQDDWFLEATQLDLDYNADEGKANQPRLRFFDHTILAFPYASFPLENRRRSGFLTPYYSQTTTRGLEFGIPYYWNIAPERDATFTPVWMARRGFQLKSDLRYLERPYAGEFRYEYLPHDPVFNANRTGLSWQHAQTFRPGLTGNVDYNKVSDDRYFVDLASQVKQVSVGNLPQDAYLTKTGGLPAAGSYSAQVRVQKFQTLQDPLAPIVPPYHRVPQLSAAATFNDLAGRFDTNLPAEYVRFVHPTMVEGSRTSVNPVLSMPRIAPGWFVTPKAGLRYAGYQLDQSTPDAATAPSMTVPWASLDSGLVFERPTRFGGRSLTQTFEPRLFYVYAPYHNQNQIPIFDTALADFNYPQLFTENRFVGGDRFGDANQVTLAATTRFLQADGQELLRGTLGQRFYFRNERVALTPDATLRTSRESDILASLGGRPRQNLSFDATTEYNPYDHRVERYSIGMRYAPEVAKLFNASYRFQRDLLRQIDISGQWPVAAGWYAVGRYNYSFFDKRLLEGLAGAEYNAGCWVFRFVVQRLQAAAEVTSTTFIFQLEFTGVGQIGTAEALQLLRRDIPGYSVINRTDPALAPPNARSRLPFEQVF